MSKKPIHISFVVHRGFLETQSVLLVCSILNVYGNKVKIHAGVPEHLGGVESGISHEFKNILTELGVEFFTVKNPIGEDYPIGNKLGCFAKVDSGIRIFLDTDVLLLRPLDLTGLSDDSIAIKPADRKTYKWSDGDWSYAYEKYSKATPSLVQMYSTCFNELMRPYYNAGVIILSGCHDFSEAWSSISKQVDSDENLANKRPWLDQLALPLAIKKLGLKATNLSEQYNFPAHLKTVPADPPCIVHYHWANILSRDHQLLKYVKKLADSYPVLSAVFSASSQQWQDLNGLIKQKRKKEVFSKDCSGRNIILTGIPRSGTSHLCSLLSKYNDTFVLNEPKEVIRPINRQPIPYGVDGFYAEIRKNIRLNKPIENKHIDGKIISDTTVEDERTLYSKPDLTPNYHLYTKNTLGYLFAIERLKQTMPDTKIFSLFRNPVDTIASWKNSFEHLEKSLPLELKTIRLQSRWLNKKDNLSLMQINSCDDDCIRRAIFWNFLAIRMIKNAHLINLLHYDDLILDTNRAINKIRNLAGHEADEMVLKSSDIRSKRSALSDAEINLIEEITHNTYQQLLRLKI